MMKETNTGHAKATDMLSLFDDSKRAVANLMARENITVQVIDGLDTAKFNPSTRILQVPNWTGLTVEQCDLLMSHEVGHALFTDATLDYTGIKPGLFSYLNIIEDARIERRLKGAFPGLAPTFYKGYREFHANGPILKGTTTALYHPKTGAEIKIASMKLIDRINLHYKIGAFVTVPFTATERAWIAKIDKASSTAECLEIARALYQEQKEQDQQSQNPSNTDQAPSKDQKQNPKPSQPENADQSDEAKASQNADQADESDDQNDSDSTESSDSDSTDDQQDGQDGSGSDDQDGAESDDQQDGNSDSTDDQDGDEDADGGADPTAATDTDTQNALRDIANKPRADQRTVQHLVYPVFPETEIAKRTVTAKQFTEEATVALTAANVPESDLDALEADWASKFMPTVKHMALEFERRKTARNLQHATTGKSGKLELTKLASYRFTDDLFKRVTVVPNGKSHGVVVLIDGSGSMSGQFGTVLDQTLMFAHFAFQVGIPFEAYMFSDSVRYDEHQSRKAQDRCLKNFGKNVLTFSENAHLVCLINTTTDRASFKRNVRILLAVRSHYLGFEGRVSDQVRYARIPNVDLCGTPLYTGILLAERHLARMKQTQKLDKTTFFLLTDGEDTDGLWYATDTLSYGNYSYHTGFDQNNGAFILRDAVTKRNHSYVNPSKYYGPVQPTNANLTVLLDVLKDRHQTRTVFIFLQEGRRSYYSRRGYGRTNATATTDGFTTLVRARKHDDAAKAFNAEKIVDTLKTDGQFVLPTDLAVADLAIILPSGKLELTENEFEKLDTTNMSQRKIAQAFTKAACKAVSNRKFVNTIVPHLA